MIPITLKGGKTELDFLALLDSGADVSAIPVSIARVLGLNLKKKKEEIVGIGGKGHAILTNAILIIKRGHERYSFPIEIYAILGPHEDDFPVIVGRKNFFERFKITFIENDKKVILKKTNKGF